jgi:cation transport ATPase
MDPDDARAVKLFFVLVIGSFVAILPFAWAKALIALCVYATAGAGFFWIWWDSREHRADQARYLIAAALLLAFGWQSFSLRLLASSNDCITLSGLLTGGAVLVCGILDHRELMRAFGRPPGAFVENQG